MALHITICSRAGDAAEYRPFQVVEVLITNASKLERSKTLALQTTFGSYDNQFLELVMEQSIGSTEYNQKHSSLDFVVYWVYDYNQIRAAAALQTVVVVWFDHIQSFEGC
jgi:hypothetical protein